MCRDSSRSTHSSLSAHAWRLFKTRWVAREARRFGIADAELMRVARQLQGGLGDDLGGGVWKKRLCHNTCRALLLGQGSRYLFFVYLFAKKAMDNIDRDALQRLRGLARLYSTYDTERLAQMLAAGSLLEIPMTEPEKNHTPPKPSQTMADADADTNADTIEQDTAAYLVAGKLPQARSHLFEAIHSAAYDLFEAGGMNLVTMRGFDRACLSDIVLSPADIRAIREANRVSQAVFARCLGTSESTIKQWESGAKRPSGMARTLLHTIGKRGLEVLS